MKLHKLKAQSYNTIQIPWNQKGPTPVLGTSSMNISFLQIIVIHWGLSEGQVDYWKKLQDVLPLIREAEVKSILCNKILLRVIMRWKFTCSNQVKYNWENIHFHPMHLYSPHNLESGAWTSSVFK